MEEKEEKCEKNEKEKRIWRRPHNPLVAHKMASIITITFVLVIVSVIFYCKVSCRFPLNQYMETICSTTAAITATMFGLSAASYAFVCSELRTEECNRPNLKQVLTKYRDLLWAGFIYSLFFTFGTVISSIIVLEIAQKLGTAGLLADTVTRTSQANNFNSNLRIISSLTFFNSLVAVVAICVMAKFNYNIFRRENRYSTIAIKLCKDSLKPYQDDQTNNSASSKGRRKKRDLSEFEKIHNIEILIDRILKNHSCMGDAFAPDHRREKLLSEVFVHKIRRDYDFTDNSPKEEDSANRRISTVISESGTRQAKCKKFASIYLNNQNDRRAKIKYKTPPQECNFVQVYADLICYRNCKLIFQNSGRLEINR